MNEHRKLGIALLDNAASRAIDAVMCQCFEQQQATGTTWETDLDATADYLNNQAQWAAVVERGGFTEFSQFTQGELLALTIIELDSPF